MIHLVNAALLLCLGTAQESSDGLGDRLRHMIDECRASWTTEEKEVLEKDLYAAFCRHEKAPAEQKDKAWAALPKLLADWEPRVTPIFTQGYEQYNERFPLPPDLREREGKAAARVVVSIIQNGLSRSPPTQDQLRMIREQEARLLEVVDQTVRPRISGEGAETAYRSAYTGASNIAEWTLGNPFKLGLDRPLTKEELERVFQHIELEAAKIDGLVIRRRPEDPSIDEWRKSGDQYVLDLEDYSIKIDQLQNAVGSTGYATVVCHPEVFHAIDELKAIRAEYKKWREDQAQLSQAGQKEKMDAILREFEPKHTKTEAPKKEEAPADRKEPASAKADRSAPVPAKPDEGSWRWFVGIAVLLALGSFLLLKLVRRAPAN